MDNKIIATPRCGWSCFLFDERANISYIDSMPQMVLLEIINALENKTSFHIVFDAEGYDYGLFSEDLKSIYMIMDDYDFVEESEKERKSLDDFCSFDQFAKWFIEDIEKDIDCWSWFSASIDTENPEEVQKEKDEILANISKIRELLAKRD